MDNTKNDPLQKFIDLYELHFNIKLNDEDAIKLSTQLIVFVENILLTNNKKEDEG